MASDWETLPRAGEWKMVATEKQQFYCKLFKDRRWDLFEEKDYHLLKCKIGYALYGPPIDVKDNAYENFYSPDRMKNIEYIFKKIKEVNEQKSIIVMAIIFIVALVENKYTEFPVFRVLSYKQEDGSEHYQFIDPYCYIYAKWKALVKTNVFPKNGIYCFPKDGFYSFDTLGEVEVEFKNKSPASWIVSGTGSFIGSVVSAPVSFVLPSKSGQNEQAIPCVSITKGILGNNRSYWFEVTSVSGSATIYAIHSNRTIAECSMKNKDFPKILTEALECGYPKTNWYAVLHYIEPILINSSRATKTHLAQFISSILFFCHAIISSNVAWQLVKEMKKDLDSGMNIAASSLNFKQKASLEATLDLSTISQNNLQTKKLSCVDDKQEIIDEVVYRIFKTERLIPDAQGNYFKVGNFLNGVTNLPETKELAGLIVNYCLFLEETVKNCTSCNRMFEGNRLEALNAFSEKIFEEDMDLQRHQSENETNRSKKTKEQEGAIVKENCVEKKEDKNIETMFLSESMDNILEHLSSYQQSEKSFSDNKTAEEEGSNVKQNVSQGPSTVKLSEAAQNYTNPTSNEIKRVERKFSQESKDNGKIPVGYSQNETVSTKKPQEQEETIVKQDEINERKQDKNNEGVLINESMGNILEHLTCYQKPEISCSGKNVSKGPSTVELPQSVQNYDTPTYNAIPVDYSQNEIDNSNKPEEQEGIIVKQDCIEINERKQDKNTEREFINESMDNIHEHSTSYEKSEISFSGKKFSQGPSTVKLPEAVQNYTKPTSNEIKREERKISQQNKNNGKNPVGYSQNEIDSSIKPEEQERTIIKQDEINERKENKNTERAFIAESKDILLEHLTSYQKPEICFSEKNTAEDEKSNFQQSVSQGSPTIQLPEAVQNYTKATSNEIKREERKISQENEDNGKTPVGYNSVSEDKENSFRGNESILETSEKSNKHFEDDEQDILEISDINNTTFETLDDRSFFSMNQSGKLDDSLDNFLDNYKLEGHLIQSLNTEDATIAQKLMKFLRDSSELINFKAVDYFKEFVDAEYKNKKPIVHNIDLNIWHFVVPDEPTDPSKLIRIEVEKNVAPGKYEIIVTYF